MIQRTNKLTSQRANPGLTLVELVIAMAVSGIIVLITFSGFRAEQQRSATKDATDRLQVELVGLQNKMQSGVAINTTYCNRGGGNYSVQGKTCAVDGDCLVAAGSPGSGQGRCISGPPGGYGISLKPGGTTYDIFIDMPHGLSSVDGKCQIEGQSLPINDCFPSVASYDQYLSSNKSLGQKIQIVRLSTNSMVAANQLDISFSGINGQVIIYDPTPSSCGVNCTTARIILKHTVTGVCYSITIDKASQIVGKRQLSPNCQ